MQPGVRPAFPGQGMPMQTQPQAGQFGAPRPGMVAGVPQMQQGGQQGFPGQPNLQQQMPGAFGPGAPRPGIAPGVGATGGFPSQQPGAMPGARPAFPQQQQPQMQAGGMQQGQMMQQQARPGMAMPAQQGQPGLTQQQMGPRGPVGQPAAGFQQQAPGMQPGMAPQQGVMGAPRPGMPAVGGAPMPGQQQQQQQGMAGAMGPRPGMPQQQQQQPMGQPQMAQQMQQQQPGAPRPGMMPQQQQPGAMVGAPQSAGAPRPGMPAAFPGQQGAMPQQQQQPGPAGMMPRGPMQQQQQAQPAFPQQQAQPQAQIGAPRPGMPLPGQQQQQAGGFPLAGGPRPMGGVGAPGGPAPQQQPIQQQQQQQAPGPFSGGPRGPAGPGGPGMMPGANGAPPFGGGPGAAAGPRPGMGMAPGPFGGAPQAAGGPPGAQQQQGPPAGMMMMMGQGGPRPAGAFPGQPGQQMMQGGPGFGQQQQQQQQPQMGGMQGMQQQPGTTAPFGMMQQQQQQGGMQQPQQGGMMMMGGAGAVPQMMQAHHQGGGMGGVAPGQGGGQNVPAVEVDNRLQCPPAYMAFTMGAMPLNAGMVAKAGLPFGLSVHPLAEGEGTLSGGIPVVNFGPAGVVRCKKCRAYVNPFVRFLDGGRHWGCNMCGYRNDVPQAYFAPTDGEGRRVDAGSRPELSCGSVEFVAPVEYMVRAPQAPVYVFAIDVSYPSVSSGMLATACTAIKSCLDRLPGDVRTMVGFVTFDSAVHYYTIKAGSRSPQQLAVADLDEPFVPAPEDLLVNLSENRGLVDQLLGSLPSLFGSTRVMESALGPGLDAAYNIMQHIGGKLLLLQSSLPSLGTGKLKLREQPKMLGGDKEHTLLAPADGDDGAFYKSKSVDFSRQQISVDTYLFSPNYTDVATLGAMSRYTAGHVYHYPGFNAAVDGERLARDLTRNLTRTTGFEAVMRLRCSKGVNITNFYGNFFIRGTDLLALPNVSADTAFNVELSHDKDEPLAPGSVIAIQAALLYTTSSGERRICVHTMAKPVTSVLSDLFRRVDADALANVMAKVALDHALRHGLQKARQYVHRTLVDIVRAYKAATSSPYGGGGGMGGGMVMGGPASTRPLPSMAGGPGSQGGPGGAQDGPMLPDSLMPLPALALGLQKCTLYRGGEAIRSDERSALVYRMLTMPTDASRRYITPAFFGLHDMPEEAGRPDPNAAPAVDPATGQPLGSVPIVLPPQLALTSESLSTAGVYLLDNTVETFVWVGRGANPGLLAALWGTPSLDGVDPAALTLPPQPNDFSGRVQAILGHLRAHISQQQRLRVVREGANDAGEARFHWHMVHDRQAYNGGSITAHEYVAIVQREAALGPSAMGGAAQ